MILLLSFTRGNGLLLTNKIPTIALSIGLRTAGQIQQKPGHLVLPVDQNMVLFMYAHCLLKQSVWYFVFMSVSGGTVP